MVRHVPAGACLALLVACGAPAPAPIEGGFPPPAEPVAEPTTARPPAAPSSSARADAGADVPPDLGSAIAATQKAVLDARFQDVTALVELARLQLLRDAPIADHDGTTDAERAKKNAMRASAVDDSSAAGRIVLVVALARSFDRAGVGGSPGALTLLDFAGASIPSGTTQTDAAASVVRGTLALARGDRKAARAAFDSATKASPTLAAGWAGLGDVERSEGRFDEAAKVYRKAAELSHGSEAERNVEAAKRREKLDVRATPLAPMSGGPLAPSRQVALCPASVASASASAAMCSAVAELAKASTSAQNEAGAMRILDAWKDIEPLCSAGDPACGPYVAAALAAAARGFRAAGLSAKAIATARLVLSQAEQLPGSKNVVADVTLDLADHYFALCVFDTAAEHYERHARERGSQQKAAAERAAFLRKAIGSAGTASAERGRCSGVLCGLERLLEDRSWVAK